MPETPDQHLIDELYRNLKSENGNGSENGHANPGGSKLTDQAVLEKIFGEEERGEEFRDTYHGVYAKHRPGWTNSEAVACILRKAAFYSGNDLIQMERLIRGSALSHSKFDEARGGSTWLRDEIHSAIAATSTTYQSRSRNGEGGYKKHSPVSKAGVAGERIIDLFKTAKQCAEETPADPDWVVYGYVVAGGITKLDGKIKTSGKTTLVTHMVSAIVSGKPLMGYRTRKTKAVILTEQAPSSFRQALKRADLEDTEDVEVLYWRDVIDVPWAEVVAAAVERAAQIGAELLLVDTVGQFDNIRGDGENSAGEAQNAMRPLQDAAGKGLAVLTTYHERKSGGDVGDSGRGSSAFGGAVDIILSLRRGDGNTRESVRVLEGVGRYDETPTKLIIELANGRYHALGDTTQYAEQEAMKSVVDILPAKPEHALATGDVHDKVMARAAVGKTAIDEALLKLTEAGTIKKLGKGVKGDPRRYYKPDPEQEPEPPLPEEDPPGGEEIHSPGIPPYKRENESEESKWEGSL